MELARRRFLHLVGTATALSAASRIAGAQSYPTRPLRLIVGYPPGGATDIVARIAGRILTERLGYPVIIENKPGASGNIAAQTVTNAAPDGYTLLLLSAANATNVTFYELLHFNLMRDIEPVAGIARVPFVMELNTSVPAKTVAEFIDYARTNPAKINMASYGVGTTNHLAGELFKSMTGIDMLHVPYRGEAQALADMIGGRVQMVFGTTLASLPYIQAGSLQGLAVTTTTRLQAFPGLPALSETLPGFEAGTWCAIGVPSGTPPDVIATLNREINAGLATSQARARLAEVITTPMVFTSAELRAYMATEIEKWAKVIKSAGIKPE